MSNKPVDDLISNLQSTLGQTLPPEFNYSYFQFAPFGFTIFKKSMKDPLKTFPVVQLTFSTQFDYATGADVVRKLCEWYAEEEHKYYRDEEPTSNTTQSINSRE